MTPFADVKYAEVWNQKCPTCAADVVLNRPSDKPKEMPSAICDNCDGVLIGFIYHQGHGYYQHFVIDVR